MSLTEPPKLEPKTKEIWAGIRELSSMVSELQAKLDDLRAKLSGFSAYKDFLKSQYSWEGYENNLDKTVAEAEEYDTGDVDETVSLLKDNFSDWSTYKGDSSTGTLSQATYDEYRSYLLNNGISSVDADSHIQLLKYLFDPDAAFAGDTGEHTDWDEFQTELENNGVSSASAKTTVGDLQEVFTTVGAMDRQVLGSASWSEFQDYLEANGLSTSEADAVIADMKTAYGSTLGSSEKDSFSTYDSWAEFNTYLTDQLGYTSEEANNIIAKLQNQYDSFDDFRLNALSSDISIETILNDSSHSESGDDGLGVKVWGSEGTTASGMDASKGDVSIRSAGRIYLEGVGAPDDGEDPIESGGELDWSATSAYDTSLEDNGSTTVSADVTNTANRPALLTANFVVNGSAEDSINLQVPGGATRSPSFVFDTEGRDYAEYEVRIGKADPVTIEYLPEGIV